MLVHDTPVKINLGIPQIRPGNGFYGPSKIGSILGVLLFI